MAISGKPFSPLESFLLDKAPVALATQQRFKLFLQENQKSVQDNAKLACIPCGMMGELLYLDSRHKNNVRFIGIDYDPKVLKEAQIFAEENE